MAAIRTDAPAARNGSPAAPSCNPVIKIAEPIALIAVPATLLLCGFFQFNQTALLTLVVAVVALGVFFAGWEASRPPLRQVMPTAVLGALAAAGRILFAPIPDVKPVTAICILAGVVFGRRSGFMVGAIAALVSNFFFGQGPWTPWQMYSWGLVGYLAGVLADAGVFGTCGQAGDLDRGGQAGDQVCGQAGGSLGQNAGRGHQSNKGRFAVYVFGFLSCYLYGLIMNTWTLVGFVHPITWQTALVVYGAGFPLDTVHAIATVVFLGLIFIPWRRKLERIKRKHALGSDRSV
ncbi:MAG: ECF transporter S component [Eggerthellales bacterium]|nr:ECF transporter S component [Eggerthellales bacterium]